MSRAIKHLHDVQLACARVRSFAAGRTMQDYQSDVYFASAIDRQLQIVGEALRRLERDAPDVAARAGDVRSIIGFRNIIVHCYDTIDARLVWDIVLNKIPALEDRLERLLQEFEPPVPDENAGR